MCVCVCEMETWLNLAGEWTKPTGCANTTSRGVYGTLCSPTPWLVVQLVLLRVPGLAPGGCQCRPRIYCTRSMYLRMYVHVCTSHALSISRPLLLEQSRRWTTSRRTRRTQRSRGGLRSSCSSGRRQMYVRTYVYRALAMQACLGRCSTFSFEVASGMHE